MILHCSLSRRLHQNRLWHVGVVHHAGNDVLRNPPPLSSRRRVSQRRIRETTWSLSKAWELRPKGAWSPKWHRKPAILLFNLHIPSGAVSTIWWCFSLFGRSIMQNPYAEGCASFLIGGKLAEFEIILLKAYREILLLQAHNISGQSATF